LEKNHFLNDGLYSDSKARMFLRRGYSLRKIIYSLKSKGIDQKNIKLSIEKIKNEKSDPDFVSAVKTCKKKRIGPMRSESNRELFYKKDMGILARSGFSYDISKKILAMGNKEFNQFLKLI
jgi:regulatory protein